MRATDELRVTLKAEEREDLSFVWDAVQALPVPFREVIHLFYYEGYPLRRFPACWIGRNPLSGPTCGEAALNSREF